MKKSKQANAPEREDGVDMMSNLPDPILHLILSRLPTTEEVTRTSILSRRWRYLWTSVRSIDIKYFRGFKSHKDSKENKFEEFVCRVLANKSIDLDSFRLCCMCYYNVSTMWQWIDTAIKRNVKLLNLRFCPKGDYEDIELPHCLVTCRSLEVLTLLIFSHRLIFPKVTGFMAWEFIFESLDSLKKVVICPLDTYEWADENLCELFAGFSHAESLSLRMCLIQEVINLEDLSESLPNLKTLKLTTTNDALSMNVLIQILICTPNLESLHLIIEKDPLHTSYQQTEEHDLEFLEMDYDCIFERLKMVNMKGMFVVPYHLGFIEFLLESSPVLETMSITLSVNMTDGKISFSTELLRFRRASPDAEIIFVHDQV